MRRETPFYALILGAVTGTGSIPNLDLIAKVDYGLIMITDNLT